MKPNYTNFGKNVTNTINDGLKKPSQAYSYYSRVLNEPFDSIEELKEAEEAYYAKLKAKEAKAVAKKADAKKVEDAFKALNAARKSFKEDLTSVTQTYHEDLTKLKKTFEAERDKIHTLLATAEENYSNELKAFTEKYPEGYHLTLKDGDFETTISSHISTKEEPFFDLFGWLFGG